MATEAKKIWPALTLLVLAPLTGEVLSSSMPPLEFLQPIPMLLQFMLYGCGALLIREVKVRKGLGWLGVFLLGLAYGIYEEGVVVRSYFDPAWMDLGILAAYGRWIGVNWIWSISLAIFHATVSIMMPLMILDLLFPAYREKPVLGKGGLIAAGIAFALMALIGPALGMKATFLQIVGCFFVMGILYHLALRLHAPDGSLEPRGRPGRFYLPGLLGTILYFITGFTLPETRLPALVTWFLLCGVVAYYWVIFRRLDRMGSLFNPVRKARFIFGSMTIWFVMDVLISRDSNRQDDIRGMAIFGILYLAVVVFLNIRESRRAARSGAPDLVQKEANH